MTFCDSNIVREQVPPQLLTSADEVIE